MERLLSRSEATELFVQNIINIAYTLHIHNSKSTRMVSRSKEIVKKFLASSLRCLGLLDSLLLDALLID